MCVCVGGGGGGGGGVETIGNDLNKAGAQVSDRKQNPGPSQVI